MGRGSPASRTRISTVIPPAGLDAVPRPEDIVTLGGVPSLLLFLPTGSYVGHADGGMYFHVDALRKRAGCPRCGERCEHALAGRHAPGTAPACWGDVETDIASAGAVVRQRAAFAGEVFFETVALRLSSRLTHVVTDHYVRGKTGSQRVYDFGSAIGNDCSNCGNRVGRRAVRCLHRDMAAAYPAPGTTLLRDFERAARDPALVRVHSRTLMTVTHPFEPRLQLSLGHPKTRTAGEWRAGYRYADGRRDDFHPDWHTVDLAAGTCRSCGEARPGASPKAVQRAGCAHVRFIRALVQRFGLS